MKALVTGGTGFLGGALARRLYAMSHEVTAMGRNSARGKRLEAEGIRFCQADLTDAERVQAACRDQTVVFHCGALSAPWGRYKAFYQANVVGTQNVVQGCRMHGVERLIHISTPSVYFFHNNRLDVKETDPLAPPANDYAGTKRMAEAVVDEAHQEGLPVVTVRPRALFGPGDTAIFPRLIRALEQGRLRVIGNGENVADLTYIDNAVDALLLCAEAPATVVLGKKYNITNGEPVRLWEVIGRVSEGLGYPLPERRVPYMIAYGLASVAELAHRTVLRDREPILTRYGVSVLAKSQTLNIDAARRDLGYTPRISIDEGLQRFLTWWKQQHS